METHTHLIRQIVITLFIGISGLLWRGILLAQDSGGSNACGGTVIYCAMNGNDSNDGSSTRPVKTLTKALALAASAGSADKVHIRIAYGNYNPTSTISLISNVIIDGGWRANTTTGVWTKDNSGSTSLSGTFGEITSNNTTHRIAFRSDGKSNWTLQDLTISVSGYNSAANQAGSYNANSGKGNSVYGVYISGASANTEIVRCRITTQAGGGGKNGSKGGDGTAGNPGVNGKIGDYDKHNGDHKSHCCPYSTSNPVYEERANVHVTGGSGGDPGVTAGTGCQPGKGGAGGLGGANKNSTDYKPGTSATAGSSGGEGRPQAVPGNKSGGRGGAGGAPGSESGKAKEYMLVSSGEMGSRGNDGQPGDNGLSYAGSTASLSNAANYGQYFIPCNGLDGGDGDGGSGGGGGGGGGGADGHRWKNVGGRYYAYASGNSGGGGGGGGGGGQGGTGGCGGGGSFAVYMYNASATVSISDSYIAAGSAGAGGAGGLGGAGKEGGNGGTSGVIGGGGNDHAWILIAKGDYETELRANGAFGGTGGKGGKGGNGGDGQKGASGTAYKVAIVTGSGLISGITSGHDNVPTDLVSAIDYGSSKTGCTNSQITTSKNGGSWYNPDITGHFIDDIKPATSSFSMSSPSVITGYGSIGNYKTVDGGASIFITQERILGDITAGATVNVCEGSSNLYRYNGTLENGDILSWKLFDNSSTPLLKASSNETYNGSQQGFSTPANLPPGTYYVKLEIDNKCCGKSIPLWKTLTVNPLPSPQITPSAPELTCNVASIRLMASGGGLYKWSNNAATAAIDVSSTGTYTVTVTNTANGCSAAKSVQVSENRTLPVPQITPSAPELTCNVTSIHLAASGGGSYKWSNNAATAAIDVSSTGTYTVTVTNTVNGCSAAKSVQVSENRTLPTPQITPSAPELTCNVASIRLTASGGGSYKWSNNAATAAIDVTSTGTYTVTVTNTANGCSAAKSVQVSENRTLPELTSPGGGGDYCVGQTIRLTTGGNGVNYSWQGPSNFASSGEDLTRPNATASMSGTYTVSSTNPANGCTVSKSANVAVHALPTASPTADVPNCNGDPITLHARAAGGSPEYSYSWNNGAAATANPVVTPSVSTLYTVVVNDRYQCATTASVYVDVFATMTASINSAIATAGFRLNQHDFVWRGQQNTNWSNYNKNWLQYVDNQCVTATTQPSASDDVFIMKYGGCVTNLPTVDNEAFAKNVTILQGASLNGGNQVLNVKGHFTNNGDFVAGTGTVRFDGSAEQNISSRNSLIFNKLAFSQTQVSYINIGIGLSVTVNKEATFTKGIVRGDLTFAANATANGGSNSSFVDGTVTKLGSGEFTFPTGNGSLFAPLRTRPATTASVRYRRGHEGMPDWWEHSGNMGSGSGKLDHVTDKEHWVVSSTGSLNGMTLFWNPSVDDHSFEEGIDSMRTHLRIAYAKHAAGCHLWTNLGGIIQSGSTKAKGSISSGDVIPANIAKAGGDKVVTFASTKKPTLVLPVELLTFTAECTSANTAIVSWSTASETDNERFILEKSDNAVDFFKLAELPAAGNSIKVTNYRHVDDNLFAGHNYYRLVQVDFDGRRTLSQVISVNCQPPSGELLVSIYPNPTSGGINVVISNLAEPFTLDIIDGIGRVVHSEQHLPTGAECRLSIDLQGLQPAVYNLQIRSDTYVVNRQVVKL